MAGPNIMVYGFNGRAQNSGEKYTYAQVLETRQIRPGPGGIRNSGDTDGPKCMRYIPRYLKFGPRCMGYIPRYLKLRKYGWANHPTDSD
jgi:hypothetical protein